MEKITIVILDDGETYSTDATVAMISQDVMEEVWAGNDQLLRKYTESGIDAVTAAGIVTEISEILSITRLHSDEFKRLVLELMRANVDGIFPEGVTPNWM